MACVLNSGSRGQVEVDVCALAGVSVALCVVLLGCVSLRIPLPRKGRKLVQKYSLPFAFVH